MAMKVALHAAAVLLSSAALALSQTTPAVTPATKAATALSNLRDKPAEYVAALADYLREFPDTDTADSASFLFRNAVPKTPAPDVVRPLAHRIMPAIDGVPSELRVRLYSDFAKVMLTHGLYAEALEMSTKAIPLLDKAKYMDYQRRINDRQMAAAKARNPEFKVREFNPAPYLARYPAFEAGVHASQGRAYVGLGKLEEADAAYHASYAIVPSTESAWGLGDVLEKRGKNADALRYYTEAVLTGKVKAAELQQFRQFYAKAHPGSDVELYLDAEYRKTYSNPIPESKYVPPAKPTGRAVLAEFFTGGGCVPCVPFDYSFERITEEYPATDVVLLVDHWHAPVIDPLGNHSVDNRLKYYGIKGAPSVYVDGVHFSTHDDNASEAETKALAPKVFDQLKKVIAERLAVQPGARLTAKASRQGDTVRMSAVVKDLAAKQAKVVMHVALVEKSVSYSGENGLRFQQMVVRNLAQPAAPGKFGFPIDATHTTAEYAFDLKRITAENLKYYDEYPEERKAEIVAEGRASVVPLLEFNWREQKNVMDPNNFVVVVYLQNEDTKEILQSLLVPVEAGK